MRNAREISAARRIPAPEIIVRRPSAADLAAAAVSSLIDEAELTPKPALVDGNGSGAHRDLDLSKLRRSALALETGFAAIARAARGIPPSLSVREEIGWIAREMERRALEASGGRVDRRGAIWALGLMVAGAACRTSNLSAASIAAVAGELARLDDRFAPRPLSHGERVRALFGVPGARGQARAGFPQVIDDGLPALRSARRRAAPEGRARLDALAAIMARLDDTSVLHRGGQGALRAVQRGARAVLTAGGTTSPFGLRMLSMLHDQLMALSTPPDGSAVLLAATLFLDRVESGGA